jgi:hypothetical protein
MDVRSLRSFRLIGFSTLLACAGSDGISEAEAIAHARENRGDDCTLEVIVPELVDPAAVNCSEGSAGPTGDPRACLLEAVQSGRDAYWLSERMSGIDSLYQYATAVRSDGTTYRFSYDSHPGGGGTGADTVSVSECLPLAGQQSLACAEPRNQTDICVYGRRVP